MVEKGKKCIGEREEGRIEVSTKSGWGMSRRMRKRRKEINIMNLIN